MLMVEMFQPIELTDNYISVLERSVPIPFKHPKINISLDEDYQKFSILGWHKKSDQFIPY
jgi:hypothetical protein